MSPEVLKLLAPGLPADLQDVLLLRQDAIREDPSLLEALERNPRLSTTSRRRIQEYRRHLVADRLAATAGAVAEEDLAEEEVLQAIEGAREAEPQGELDEITGLTEGQVRTLPILVRLKLSRGASRSLRSILVRDPHPRVAVSVVKHNALSDSEIEQVAANRAVAEEVLEEIARHEIWIRKYPILHALARNPKTPTSIAVRLLPRLSVRDLRGLSRDRNASEAIRKKALRLYTIKRG